MSRFFIYTALGPTRPLIFATINANRELLEKNNVYLAPFSPWNCAPIPTHGGPYMKAVPVSVSAPELLTPFLTDIEQHLDAGKNILLFSGAVNALSHQSLARFLQHSKIPKKHTVKLLFSVGTPTLLYESICREYAIPFSDQAASALSKMCCSVPELIESTRMTWGEENVALLADRADSPTVTCNEALASQIFAWLGCPAPQYPKPLPRHPLFLASYTARRLNWALQVHDNIWPMLDETLYFETLRNVERNWGTEPFSPKKYRDELNAADKAASRNFEAMLDLPSDTLTCPDWLVTLPGIDVPPPLPKDKIREFVAALPKSIRDPLHQRFANDAVILTPALKALDAARIDAEPTYVHIGEPKQPVELTVLTMAYNQEKFIGECIESVLAQRTTFPVRHIVLDHHSTDDTPKIIARYAEQYDSIRPVLLNFRRPAENVRGLFARCRTRYAALCDGDDYSQTNSSCRNKLTIWKSTRISPCVFTRPSSPSRGLYATLKFSLYLTFCQAERARNTFWRIFFTVISSRRIRQFIAGAFVTAYQNGSAPTFAQVIGTGTSYTPRSERLVFCARLCQSTAVMQTACIIRRRFPFATTGANGAYWNCVPTRRMTNISKGAISTSLRNLQAKSLLTSSQFL